MGTGAAVRLEPWGPQDAGLLRRLTGDPAMMEHLGGAAESDAKLAERQARYAAPQDPAVNGAFRVVDVASGTAAGWVGYWEHEWRAAMVYEMGWSVLPEFQGRGIARAAALAAIEVARAQRRHRHIHAFPAVANAASNAVCRAAGFTLLGEVDLDYPPGNMMRCNDWRLDLFAAS